jgi:hypothetical protein
MIKSPRDPRPNVKAAATRADNSDEPDLINE